MKVSEAIDRLEAGDTVWVKGKVMDKDDTEFPIQIGGKGYSLNTWTNRDVEISLSEPQAEKVEITERQAQLLEAYEGETLYALLGECNEYEQELLAKAKLFGYTVKPKRWVVKRKNGSYVNDFQEAKFCVGIGITLEMDCLPPFTFTDKSKAEAVAVLVEGSVEEV